MGAWPASCFYHRLQQRAECLLFRNDNAKNSDSGLSSLGKTGGERKCQWRKHFHPKSSWWLGGTPDGAALSGRGRALPRPDMSWSGRPGPSRAASPSLEPTAQPHAQGWGGRSPQHSPGQRGLSRAGSGQRPSAHQGQNSGDLHKAPPSSEGPLLSVFLLLW